jgi:predicted acyl esterase
LAIEVRERLEAGKVYKVTLQPMTTSNYFEAGHRIRIEVSSSISRVLIVT